MRIWKKTKNPKGDEQIAKLNVRVVGLSIATILSLFLVLAIMYAAPGYLTATIILFSIISAITIYTYVDLHLLKKEHAAEKLSQEKDKTYTTLLE